MRNTTSAGRERGTQEGGDAGGSAFGSVGSVSTPAPWVDVIPAADQGSFDRHFLDMSRSLSVGIRPAVIVVDMTKEFVDPAYSTGCRGGQSAVVNTRALLDCARAHAIPVVYSKAFPDPGHELRSFELGRWKSKAEPTSGGTLPSGDVIVEEVAPEPSDLVIHKGTRPSAFFGTTLAAHLVYLGCDTVIVAGLSTSGCVRATVVDAFQYNFHVVIPAECVADRSEISHKVSLFDLHMKYADVVTVGVACEYLGSV